jgi:NADH dehydrogenase
MEVKNVCVIGGSGFVGRHIVQLLSAQRYQVRVPTRQRERAKQLILLPTVDVIEANVHDEAQLARLTRRMDAVINLVGVLHDAHGERGFEQAHVVLARKLIAVCRANGVTRYVHMSALGADINGPSKYQRTKGEAEALVRASGLAWTIFRPSVMFGRGDRFLNMFAACSDCCRQWFSAVPMRAFSRCMSKMSRPHSSAASRMVKRSRALTIYAARGFTRCASWWR